MKIHFETIDNLSLLLYPKLNTIDQANSFGGTFSFKEELAYEKPHALYQESATENDKIWNLEASFGPRTLREHKIDTVELLHKSVPALWKFVTTKYLKHKAIPRKGKKDKEFDKAPLSETWLLLQRCHGVDETTPDLVSTTEKLEDVSGIYQLNKIKKRLLRYAVINGINPYDLTTILEAIGEHLTSEGKLGSLKWNEFVDKHYVNPSQVGELKHLDL